MDGVGYEATSVGLDEHQLQHVNLLVSYPCLVELLKVLGHIIDDLLHGYIHVVFDDSLIYASNDSLDYSELLEQFASGVEDLLRENVLLAVDP